MTRWVLVLAALVLPACGPSFLLTVTVDDGGVVRSDPAGIDCRAGGDACSGVFLNGTNVKLTGTADSEGMVPRWSGACDQAGGSCTVRMSTPRAVAAEFLFPVLVRAEGAGAVTMFPAPDAGIGSEFLECDGGCAGVVRPGLVAVFVATPGPGHLEGPWELEDGGELCGDYSYGRCVVLVDRPIAGRARFVLPGTVVAASSVGVAGTADVVGVSVLRDPPRIVVGGTFTGELASDAGTLQSAGASDIFIASFTESVLQNRYVRTFGGPGADHLWDVYRGPWPLDEVTIAGSYETSMSLGPSPLASNGRLDGFLAVVDPDPMSFSRVWSLGGPADDAAANRWVALLDGGTVVVGGFEGPGGQDGGAPPLIVTIRGGAAVSAAAFFEGGGWMPQGRIPPVLGTAVTFSGTAQTEDGGFTSAGGTDILVTYDVGFARFLFGGPGQDEARQFVYAMSGDLLVGCFEQTANVGRVVTSAGGRDGFVSKLLTPLPWRGRGPAPGWVVSLGGAGDDCVTGAAGEDPIVVVGWFEGTLTTPAGILKSHGGKDVFVVELGSAGNIIRALSFGGPGDDRALAVAEDWSGRWVVVAGTFSQTATFGEKQLVAQGGTDAFVLNIAL